MSATEDATDSTQAHRAPACAHTTQVSMGERARARWSNGHVNEDATPNSRAPSSTDGRPLVASDF
jgi:hypothetical protein